MKLITRDTDYALRALCYISMHKERMVSAAELVRRLKIPRPFLRKILQALNKSRMLKSYKGQGGGFKLRLAAGEIYLLDILRIFQGEFKLNECLFKKEVCPNVRRCMLKKKLDRIEGLVVGELKNITISSLIRGG
mgnify:CR=1 FL=1